MNQFTVDVGSVIAEHVVKHDVQGSDHHASVVVRVDLHHDSLENKTCAGNQ